MILLNQSNPQFLASVTSLHEAQLAIDADVDIIDLKNPLEGALGALPLNVVKEIVALVNKRILVSATVGDLPMNPSLIKSAVDQLILTGVDIIKVGFFGNQNHLDCVHVLKQSAEKYTKIVAVLFADQQPSIELLNALRASGFYGVMLDTANKSLGGLFDHQSIGSLCMFTQKAKSLGLFSGLAGSLKEKEISELKKTGVDYLGFRGALCAGENRQSEMVFEKLMGIKQSISM